MLTCGIALSASGGPSRRPVVPPGGARAQADLWAASRCLAAVKSQALMLGGLWSIVYQLPGLRPLAPGAAEADNSFCSAVALAQQLCDFSGKKKKKIFLYTCSLEAWCRGGGESALLAL